MFLLRSHGSFATALLFLFSMAGCSRSELAQKTETKQPQPSRSAPSTKRQLLDWKATGPQLGAPVALSIEEVNPQDRNQVDAALAELMEKQSTKAQDTKPGRKPRLSAVAEQR